MRQVALKDFDLLSFGNEIQILGCIFEGDGRLLLAPFPDQPIDAVVSIVPELLEMDASDWSALLLQTDVGDVRTPSGIVLRKGKRQIDSNVAWRVYERDDFRCRYCGSRKPLTVDHVDLWENGGVTAIENLLSSCRSCNKLRGNREYDEWLASPDYSKRLSRLPAATQAANAAIIETLRHLRTLRVSTDRTR